MKYAFFGTPEFASMILEKLIGGGYAPDLVITNPDKPAGRKKIITAPPTKVLAQKNKIQVWQPENLNVNEFKEKLKNFDFAIIAAYAKIIPKEIISIPRLGTIVVHPSLLPRWRGATPIQSAILAGDTMTGTTLILADEKVDHGPILAGKETEIKKEDNYESLLKFLADLSGELLVKNIPLWLQGKVSPQIQNENYATYTKKFKSEDAYVDLKKDDPVLIERKVRALNPEPGVWTTENGKRVKILEVKIIEGKIKLSRVQVEGKKPQNI